MTRRWATIALPMLAAISLAGCDEVTRWDARGSWRGSLTLPGEPGTSAQGSVYAPEEARTKPRRQMCELREVTLGLPFTGAVRDEPAAVRVRTPEPLCRRGSSLLDGGSVLVWMPEGQDASTLRALPSDRWVVSGEMEILRYEDAGLPDLDVGDSATTEMVWGTFAVTAVDSTGRTVVLEGTFELAITATRVEISLS